MMRETERAAGNTGTTIYRATETTETGIPSGSCWSEDRETAEAYTDNPGYGGAHIRELTVELEGVLDITDGLESLADALGYDEPERTASDWRMSCWAYPWEESESVRRQLSESGYQWLRYVDDYPEGAITLMRI